MSTNDDLKINAPTTDNNGLGNIIGYDTCGQPIIPVRDKLEIFTNRHPNCYGTSWGWIEGCSLNICWSNKIIDLIERRQRSWFVGIITVKKMLHPH